jgi:hypothetical protein
VLTFDFLPLPSFVVAVGWLYAGMTVKQQQHLLLFEGATRESWSGIPLPTDKFNFCPFTNKLT